MEKIKRFFECFVPVTACNLKCSYCYIIQRHHRSMGIPKLQYSIEHISKALTKERLGGTCYFSLCGAGETLLADRIIELIYALLRNGHYVNVTTNGTLSEKFKEFSRFPPEYMDRLHIAFSFHYLELLRINRLEEFFQNVLFMRGLGSSIVVQINLCDEYEPYLNEIRSICQDRLGAYPQVAATRREIDLNQKIEVLTEHTLNDYLSMGKNFKSPLFDFTMKNFNVKRKEFCYAGDWSGVLNIYDGILRKCYAESEGQNIYENIADKIHFSAVGRCNSLFCMNSSHFLSLGTIPKLYTDTTYAGLRDRPEVNWYSPNMKNVLSAKLCESNHEYTEWQKKKILWLADRKIQINRSICEFKRVIKKAIKYKKR